MTQTIQQSPRAAATDQGRDTAARFAVSAQAHEGVQTGTAAFHAWLADCRARTRTTVEPRPLDALKHWRTDPQTGNIGHHSGRFFTVRGLSVEVPGAAVARWQQPIISQPEVGILGILVKEFDGVPHFLMQAKAEPGNINGIQLSPTVQATRSNYTGVHGGKPVNYLHYFRDTARHRVLADVRQSEQGAWFHQKRNRNMIVEVTGQVETLDGFCWLTLAQLSELLRLDDLVNMDTRSVLSCLPVPGPGAASAHHHLQPGRDRFRRALHHSLDPGFRAVHTGAQILGWITEERTRQERHVREIPLGTVTGWHLRDGRIRHEKDLFFDVVGVSVEAVGREVGSWEQPMIAPRGTGLVALLVREIDGVLHALLHARVEAGHLDVLELAPTVQCTPDTYEHLPPEARPRFLDTVLAAPPEDVRFDAVHSEEGGRFLHARTRYLVVETDTDVADGPDHRWLALHQIGDLLRHSHYLNIQARSVVACLHSLAGRPPAENGAGAPQEADGRADPEGRQQP